MTKHSHLFLLIAVFSVIITFGFISFSGMNIHAADSWISEDGSPENPYIITTADELKTISDNPSLCYKLGCDIDMNKESILPICNESNPFSGSFDGGFYTIKNYRCTTSDSMGLFGCIGETGSVKNLALEGAYIYSSGSYAGAIAAINRGEISCCSCDIKLYCMKKKEIGGGLVGKNSGTIENCRSSGSINGVYAAVIGGIAGENTNNVSYCYSIATVSTANTRGGITGTGDSTLCHFLYKNSVYKSGSDTSSGVGDSREAMITADTYIGWDFVNIWGIDNSYPYLINTENSALLKNLSIGVDLSPEFSPNVFEYTAECDSSLSSLTVDAASLSSYASVSINGSETEKTVALNSGSNKIIINVTAKNGDVKTYTITVNKKLSSNCYLSSLSLSNLSISPEFNSKTYAYTAAADSSLEKTSVIAESEDKNSIILINSKENTEVNLNNGENVIEITVTAEDGSEKTYTVTVTKKLSSNCNLNSLSLSGVSISPEFNSKTIYYTATAESYIENTSVFAESEDENAIISINGKDDTDIALNTGENVIEITVTAEDGSEKTYFVTVTRKRSSDCYLSSVSLSGLTLSPKFDCNTFYYTSTAENNFEETTVTATAEDPTALVLINGKENCEIALNTGENIINITVTAEDGSEKTYTVTVTRKPSSDCYLSSLSLSGLSISPEFNSNTYSYSATAESDLEKTLVTAKSEDSTALVSINGEENCEINLNTGENIIKVTVTAENGTKKTYTVTVNKKLSSNCNLKSLSISGLILNEEFSPDTLTYSATAKNTLSSVTVSAQKEDSDSIIKINGTDDTEIQLSYGSNTIKILVTAPDNTKKVYTISIYREYSYTADLSNLEIEGLELSPQFSSSVYSYSATTDFSTFETNIKATACDSSATIYYNGSTDSTVSLSVGENDIEIMAVCPNGVSKTYYVKIYREACSMPYLKSLSLSCGELSSSFEPAVLTYSATASANDDTVTISAVPLESDATVLINDSLDNIVALNYGENKIDIGVILKNGVKSTYTVTVIRNHTEAAELKNLTVNSGVFSPSFSSNEFNYTVTLPWSQTVLVTPTAYSASSKITVDGNMVQSGESTAIYLSRYNPVINVAVTSSSGETATYSLSLAIDYGGSETAELQNIIVDSGKVKPNFSTDVTEYYTWVENSKTSINIIPIPSSNNETITINGETVGVSGYSMNLDEGDNYAVISATLGNETKEYLLTITRRLNEDSIVSSAPLDSLKISDFILSPAFDPEETLYNIDVNKVTDTLKFTPGCYDSQKTITVENKVLISGNESSYSLKADVSYIIIKVTKGESFKKYVLTVTKNDNPLKKGLSSLVLSDGSLSPQFSNTVSDYSVTVENSVSKIYINATPNDEDAAVTINSSSATSAELLPGYNTILLAVTDSTGETTTYKLTVFRKFSPTISISYTDSSGEYSSEIPDSVLYGSADAALTLKLGDDYFCVPQYILTLYKYDSPLYLKEKRLYGSDLESACLLADSDVSVIGGTKIYLSGGLSDGISEIATYVTLKLNADEKSDLKNGIAMIYYFDPETGSFTKVDSDFEISSSQVSFKANKTGFYIIAAKLTENISNYTFTADSSYTVLNGNKTFTCYLRREADSIRNTDLHVLVISTLKNGLTEEKTINLRGDSTDFDVTVNNSAVNSNVYLYSGSYNGKNLPATIGSAHTVS